MPPQNNSSQNLIDIDTIRDGVVVLKNGGLRAILMASSINFFLKSAEEQDAVISGYQSFLNSLDFPTQITIISRQLKIDAYLEALKKSEKEQANDLLKMQTAEYIDFIKQLIEMSNIMSKSFYISVPFSMMETKQKGIGQKISSILKPKQMATASEENFQQTKGQLMQRVDLVTSSLGSLGVQTVMLNTQEIVELFYNIYNPDLSEKGKIAELGELSIETK